MRRTLDAFSMALFAPALWLLVLSATTPIPCVVDQFNGTNYSIEATQDMRPCISRGRWELDGPLEKRWYEPSRRGMVTDSGGACPRRESWVWRTPEGCDLPKWNASRFCELLGPGGRVALVGDSITRIWSEALIGQLRESALCKAYRTRVRRFFSKFLHVQCPAAEGCSRVVRSMYKWARPDALKHDDVVVFNSGAHYQADRLFVQNMCRAATLASQLVRPGALKVFRNTPFGHSRCHTHVEPFASIEAAEAYSDKWPFWHGKMFKSQNALAEQIWRAHGAAIIDTYTPTSMRPDYHIAKCTNVKEGRNGVGKCLNHDCLHYCVKGPTLHWSRLLLDVMENNRIAPRPPEPESGDVEVDDETQLDRPHAGRLRLAAGAVAMLLLAVLVRTMGRKGGS